MELTRRLRKVGGSIMVSIPPELLRDSGLQLDAVVRLRSQPGRIEIEPTEASPSQDVVSFAARFTTRYRQALKELARR
jgi:antitoxin component of MazEF toxin-antitoxin module